MIFLLKKNYSEYMYKNGIIYVMLLTPNINNTQVIFVILSEIWFHSVWYLERLWGYQRGMQRWEGVKTASC